MSSIKQVVILAGGKGTRMREMTEDLPKPMVPIGGIPVLDHLINIYEKHGNFEYLICSGYLGEIIKKHYESVNNVKVIDTGLNTNTGGRLLKLKELLDEEFMITYGDGLANVNISELINFHKSNKTIGTLTVTNPVSRFGLVEFDKNYKVKKFIEKPVLSGFINIGFMIFKKSFLDYIENNSILESEPLINLSNDLELSAYTHNGYFEPMDTYREYLNMNNLWESGNPPWMNNE